jgi:hypothetical protein
VRVATLKFRFTVKALVTHEFNSMYLHISINYNEKTMNSFQSSLLIVVCSKHLESGQNVCGFREWKELCGLFNVSKSSGYPFELSLLE